MVASTSAGDLATVEAVTSSPVAGVLGLSGASKDHSGLWDLLARRLTKQLGLNHDKLTTSERCVRKRCTVRGHLRCQPKRVCAPAKVVLCWTDS